MTSSTVENTPVPPAEVEMPLRHHDEITGVAQRKMDLLYLAREIDDAGEISPEAADRIAAASPQATSLQLRVLATRLQLSLHREGKRLPPEYSEWNPWEFDFSHGWRLAAADAAWALEPHLSKNRLPEWIGILDINGTLDASERGLVLIPESIGELIVANGHLKLSRNLIAHLPEDFYTVTVDWDLRLEGNRITRLPQALGHLQVGGSLRLSHNRISCLPETLGHLRVGRDLRLSHNQIQSLPASVGRLDIRGTLALQRNNLVSLPPEIGNLCVGNDLRLDRNLIVHLPGEIAQTRIGGNLWVGGNPLQALPPKEVLPRLVVDNGASNRCLRGWIQFAIDVVLGANGVSLVSLMVSSSTGLAPPGTGWRMALSPQEPEPTGYLVACFFLLGLTNAGFRSVERCYQIKPDPWRRHLIYPWIWSQLHVAYDAAAVGLRFEDAEGWIVYYCFTMLAYFFHSVTLILLYSWVMMENFQGVPLRR